MAKDADGGTFPAGIGFDEAVEKKLEGQLGKLVDLTGAEKPDFAALRKHLAETRETLRPLVIRQRKLERKGVDEELRVPWGFTRENDAPEIPVRIPIVVFGKAGADRIRAAWLEQLRFFASSARDLLAGESGAIREFLGWPFIRKQHYRPLAITECLRECAKLVELLSRPAGEVEVEKGEQLFADDFSEGADEWLQYGQCIARNDGDAFRLKDEKVAHPDAQMFTKRQFEGDFLAEFTFIPHTEGTKAGALFTICARPRAGKDLAVSVGETMNTYNFGIDGYHFSMHRGTSGRGNARRVGPGLKMLASGRDPCPTPGQAYRVAIGRAGVQIFLIVDGELVHNYYDAGTYGGTLSEGHIGLRHWAGLDASYRDFRVYRLKARGKAAAARLIEPRGKVLYEEKFENLEAWRHEGRGRMVLDAEEKGAMRLEIVGSGQGKAGSQAFCTLDFPHRVAVEYEVKVLTTKGLILNFVAMRGAKGEDMFDPKMPKREGIFNDYVRNPLLRSYHFSISRYGDKGRHTGVSNSRRNPGVHLMSQGPDLCKETGKWYRVRLVKDGPHLQLGVNGELAHEFTDPLELETPVPDGGKVGFRAIGAEVRALIR
ncbi:MAG: DUF1961 family protein, partial [Planctomycetota bacterium]